MNAAARVASAADAMPEPLAAEGESGKSCDARHKFCPLCSSAGPACAQEEALLLDIIGEASPCVPSPA